MSETPSNPSPVHGPVVVGKAYEMVFWLVQKVEKFPRLYRFSVGQRVIGTRPIALGRITLVATRACRKGEA